MSQLARHVFITNAVRVKAKCREETLQWRYLCRKHISCILQSPATRPQLHTETRPSRSPSNGTGSATNHRLEKTQPVVATMRARNSDLRDESRLSTIAADVEHVEALRWGSSFGWALRDDGVRRRTTEWETL
ncbi:hypothetical protein V9T40_001049 [Parthenolecanium corni]|uniref:Uncharacterized protein n=1 Tax=Parthenolecanium corni TaxID=536013 RepID=A0AAN9Y281_9HEMI